MRVFYSIARIVFIVFSVFIFQLRADNSAVIQIENASDKTPVNKTIGFGLGRTLIVLPNTMNGDAKDLKVPMVLSGYINGYYAFAPIDKSKTPQWAKDKLFLCVKGPNGFYWQRSLQNTIEFSGLQDLVWTPPNGKANKDYPVDLLGGLSLVTYQKKKDDKFYLIISDWTQNLKLYSVTTTYNKEESVNRYLASYEKTYKLPNFSATRLDIIDTSSLGRDMDPHLVVWGRSWNRGGYKGWSDESLSWSTGLQLFRIKTDNHSLNKTTDYAYWDFPVDKKEKNNPTLHPLDQTKFDKHTKPLRYGTFTGSSWTGVDKNGVLSLYFTHHKGTILSDSGGNRRADSKHLQLYNHISTVYYLNLSYDKENHEQLVFIPQKVDSASGVNKSTPFTHSYTQFTVPYFINNEQTLINNLRGTLGANSYPYRIQVDDNKLYYYPELPNVDSRETKAIKKAYSKSLKHKDAAGKFINYVPYKQTGSDDVSAVVTKAEVRPNPNLTIDQGPMGDAKSYVFKNAADVELVLWGFGYGVTNGNTEAVKSFGLTMAKSEANYRVNSSKSADKVSSEQGLKFKFVKLFNASAGYKFTSDQMHSESNSNTKTINVAYNYVPSQGMDTEDIADLGLVAYRFRSPWVGYAGELKGVGGQDVSILNQSKKEAALSIMSLGLAAVPQEESVSFQTFSLKTPSQSLTHGFDEVTDFDKAPNPLSEGLASGHPANELKINEQQGVTLATLLNEVRAWQESQVELKQLVMDVNSYGSWLNDPNPHQRSGVKPLLSSGSYTSYNLQSNVKLALEFKKVNETSWLNTYGNGVTWDVDMYFKGGPVKEGGLYAKGSFIHENGTGETNSTTKTYKAEINFGGNALAEGSHDIHFYMVAIDVLAYKSRPGVQKRPSWMPVWCWETNDNYILAFSWVPPLK